MCVDGAVRRHGVASVLIRHLEAWAAAQGFQTVCLSTLATMRHAVSLYPTQGFAYVGSPEGRHEVYEGFAIYVVEMVKALPPAPG